MEKARSPAQSLCMWFVEVAQVTPVQTPVDGSCRSGSARAPPNRAYLIAGTLHCPGYLDLWHVNGSLRGPPWRRKRTRRRTGCYPKSAALRMCVSLKHYSRSSVEYSLCVLQSLLQQPQHCQIIRARLRLVLQRRFCSLHPSVSKRPKFPRQTPPHNRKLILLVGRRSTSPLLFGHSQSVLRMVGQSACTRPDVLA